MLNNNQLILRLHGPAVFLLEGQLPIHVYYIYVSLEVNQYALFATYAAVITVQLFVHYLQLSSINLSKTNEADAFFFAYIILLSSSLTRLDQHYSCRVSCISIHFFIPRHVIVREPTS